MPDLAIVIVNYRTAGLVIDCLASLVTERSVCHFKVVVVDNASGDDSPDQICQAISDHDWSEWVQVLRSPVNGGFSAGNNLGMQSLKAGGYLLLNSDTIVRPGAVVKLIEEFHRNPRAGLIGPRLEFPDGTAQVSCFRFPSFFSEVIRGACTGPVTRILRKWNVPIPVSDCDAEPEWLSFAAVLIRGEVLDKVGMMDDGFFMYFEDVDYCRRAVSAGWDLACCPDAHIVHLHGQSSGLTELNAAVKRRPAYYYAARARYLRKWHGIAGMVAANLGWCLGRMIGFTRELMGRRRTSCDREWIDNWVYLHDTDRPPHAGGS